MGWFRFSRLLAVFLVWVALVVWLAALFSIWGVRGFIAYGYFLLVRMRDRFIRFFPIFDGSFSYFFVLYFCRLRSFFVGFLLNVYKAKGEHVTTGVLINRIFRYRRIRFVYRTMTNSRHSYGFYYLFSVVKNSNHSLAGCSLLYHASTYGYDGLVLGFFFHRRVFVALLGLRDMTRYA